MLIIFSVLAIAQNKDIIFLIMHNASQKTTINFFSNENIIYIFRKNDVLFKVTKNFFQKFSRFKSLPSFFLFFFVRDFVFRASRFFENTNSDNEYAICYFDKQTVSNIKTKTRLAICFIDDDQNVWSVDL